MQLVNLYQSENHKWFVVPTGLFWYIPTAFAEGEGGRAKVESKLTFTAKLGENFVFFLSAKD